MNRRNFIVQSSLAASTIGIPQLVQTVNNKIENKDKIKILFQGDSITDVQRKRDHYYANNALGMGVGYVQQTVAQLLGKYPQKNLKCYNRGISGNKVYQLINRWEEDCLQIKPDILSILIGVNDFWHTLSGHYKGTVETYDMDYRRLLDMTKKDLPKTQIIIAEPFILRGTAIKESEWYPAFAAYQKVAKKIATDYDATFIPLQAIFDEALKTAPVSYWCPDGVHPSMGGAYLMAKAWLEVFVQKL